MQLRMRRRLLEGESEAHVTAKDRRTDHLPHEHDSNSEKQEASRGSTTGTNSTSTKESKEKSDGGAEIPQAGQA